MKRLLKWWPLLAWVAFAALVNLAAVYQVIPHKLFEFLFIFWIGISLIFAIPTFCTFMDDWEEYEMYSRARKRAAAHSKLLDDIANTGIKRRWCWKTARMVETKPVREGTVNDKQS